MHRQHVVSRRVRSWFLAYPGYQVLGCRRWNNQFKLAEWNTARYTWAAREREREVHNEGRADTRTIDRRAERCRRGSIWRREIHPPLPPSPPPPTELGFVDPIRWNSSANIMSFVCRAASLVSYFNATTRRNEFFRFQFSLTPGIGRK